MEWYNEPPMWQAAGNTITVTSGAKTDFWRKTHDGGIRDHGHFYHQSVGGDFSAEVTVAARYSAQYDQAGIMVRQDETTWLKCGIELLDGVQQASAVVTRDYSDWSVLPLPDNPPAVSFRVARHGSTLEISYALEDEPYTLLRQAFLTDEPIVQVGLMCCAPTGEGVTVSFENFTVRQG